MEKLQACARIRTVIEHPGADTMPTSIFVCDNNGMVVICGATSSYWTNLDLRFLWLGQKRLQGSHSATPEDYGRFVDFIVKNNIRQPVGQIFSWDEIPLAQAASRRQMRSRTNGSKDNIKSTTGGFTKWTTSKE